MSQAAQATPAERISFEQWLFLKSPVGTAATAAIFFVLATGSYALVAALTHTPLLLDTAQGLRIAPYAWSALVLSLLMSTVLGMQRYTRNKERADEPAFIAIAASAATAATILRPASPKRMLWANALGAVAGIGLAFATAPSAYWQDHPALFAWSIAITMFLGALFARGVVMTAQGGRAFAHLIENELRIDLLHVDKLAVIGRHSARNALIWFTVAAIVCLFFVGEIDSTVIAILIVCAGMGLWIFFRPMEQVHRRIRAEKSAELDRIRTDIDDVRGAAVHDAGAAARLQGLLAYEARIHAVHEWPFDQTTLMRVAAYVLIPAIPWFGEAVVSDLIQRMAR
jgi:hypothetical protein